MVLLLDVGGEPCGDAVAVVLDLDAEGVITAERRFHRIDRLGTCGAPPVPAQGWWHSVSLPAAPWVLRTGTLPVEGGASDGIAVWNGDPGVTPLISWARQRFADAGLPPPTPSSVTFLPDVPGDRWDTYGFLTGSDATDIGVPVMAEEACTGDPCQWSMEARAAMLHELAHVWIQATPYYVRPTTKALGPRALSFVEHHDLVWYDPTLPWGQRGTERAAETLTWGLMDQPYTVDARLGRLTCAELAEDFTMLTSSSPDPRSCAETAEEGAP